MAVAVWEEVQGIDLFDPNFLRLSSAFVEKF